MIGISIHQFWNRVSQYSKMKFKMLRRFFSKFQYFSLIWLLPIERSMKFEFISYFLGIYSCYNAFQATDKSGSQSKQYDFRLVSKSDTDTRFQD